MAALPNCVISPKARKLMSSFLILGLDECFLYVSDA